MTIQHDTEAPNRLYYGDNLDVLRNLESESVDLIYLDPPFNSARNYNVIFAHNDVHADVGAQIQVFGDTWVWTPETEQQYTEYVSSGPAGLPTPVADWLVGMRGFLGPNDAAAYLVNMAPRLVELHRVLKSTGSFFLHCDPTMSHYLKILLDAIFGPEKFTNEIVWQRTMAKSYQTKRLPRNHDSILFYVKSDDAVWNADSTFLEYDPFNLPAKTEAKYSHEDADGRRYRLDNLTGPNDPRPNLTYEFLGVERRWRWTKERMQKAYDDGLIVQTGPGMVPQLKRYLDEQRGLPLGDVWTDIPPINSQAAERLGYPTQKPVALLERIISAASNPGDVVLDPFAGCGTTIDAAQKLHRRWIGIDVAHIAIDLINRRLTATYGESVRAEYTVTGVPKDVTGAQALFEADPFDFERWAVAFLDARPNERSKQQGDKGVDGIGRFLLGGGKFGRVLVSVKGGKQLNPAMVRELSGTLDAQGAELGVLITLREPTKGMIDAANTGGVWVHPANQISYPRLQIITVAQLLAGERPKLPLHADPYYGARRRTEKGAQGYLDL